MSAEILENQNVFFPIENQLLKGILTIPPKAKGVILFVHEFGSDRLCPRDTMVAKALHESGFATFLFDLFSEDEQLKSSSHFKSASLNDRLVAATKWITKQESTRHLMLGYFGGTQGVSAALSASTFMGFELKAIISRGGTPDLSAPVNNKRISPILLVVGSVKRSHTASQEEKTPKYIQNEFISDDIDTSCEDLERLKLIADISISWFDLYIRSSDEKIALPN